MKSSFFFPLERTPGAKGVYLKEIDGHAEFLAMDGGTPALIEWLDYLIEDREKQPGLLSAKDLVVPDRDQLIAFLYRSLYGPSISSTIECRFCKSLFDFSFSLDDLIGHINQQTSSEKIQVKEEGVYEMTDGTRFRLPTGKDELEVTVFPPDQQTRELLDLCLISSGMESMEENIEQAMMQVAPLLESELLARCPECGQEQRFHFDVQSLLMLKMAGEKRELVRQVHLIAGSYHWAHKEILDLPRRERQAYSALIANERGQ